MPHTDYDAARAERRRATEEEPLTFTLCGRLFRVAPSPSLGDTFDLMDAPEPDGLPENEAQAFHAMAKWIRRSLVADQRATWDQVLYELTPEDGPVLLAIGADLAEQYLARPTQRPDESSSGPSTGGATSRPTGSPDLVSP